MESGAYSCASVVTDTKASIDGWRCRIQLQLHSVDELKEFREPEGRWREAPQG